MSFWIYRNDNGGAKRHQQAKLTGADGVLSEYLRGCGDEETPLAWELEEAELIRRSAGDDADAGSLAMVMEMTDPSGTVLYRLTAIRGCSDIDDTDLVLCFTMLRGDGDRGDARQFLEPMRLTGGTEQGRYFWARPKMDIGAAVC